ncbi:MAG: hypothetical protein EHM84_07190, partial [Lysobacterales bacterium]
MRSRGLKIRLLTIAISAGVCITATLFLLEYLEYRKSGVLIAEQGERSLMSAEAQRLDRAASDLAATNASTIEDALRSGDALAVNRSLSAILEHPAAIAAHVTRGDEIVYEAKRADGWTATLAPQELRSV